MDIPVLKNLKNLAEYIVLTQVHPSPHWIYRGQSDQNWVLKPKAGREQYFQPQTPERIQRRLVHLDLGQFKAWRESAIAYCEKLPEHEIECLAYAQHYGLATRLLDWTTNPLVALYFAVEADPDRDGSVFCYFPWHVVTEEARLVQISGIARYMPRPFDRRILAQSGVFTYHPEPDKAVVANEARPEIVKISPTKSDLVRINIDKSVKPLLQQHLSELGISRKFLFPDLEGLSRHINWDMRRCVEFSQPK